MQKFTCPSCGAEINFQSNISVCAVCKHCASMVVRHDKDVESIGKMAQLPDDVSPLQIGTEGTYRGMRFGLIGRAKMGWQDGSWNEWFMYVDDGRKGWLAEAQGFFAVSFEFDGSIHPGAQKTLEKVTEKFRSQQAADNKTFRNNSALGKVVTIGGKALQIVDIKDAECIGSEGELPFTAAKGRKATYIDLIGENKEFGSIEYSGNSTRIYLGEYVEFDDLRFSHLREMEGWSKTTPAPVTGITQKKSKAPDGW